MGKKKKVQDLPVANNLVAKHAGEFNKSVTMIDRKKEQRKNGGNNKHKGKLHDE